MKMYSRVTHENPGQRGRIEVFGDCGCLALPTGEFKACQLHKGNADIEQAFTQRLREEQENYDQGLRVTRNMVPPSDPELVGSN